jgi:hypothetical protein
MGGYMNNKAQSNESSAGAGAHTQGPWVVRVEKVNAYDTAHKIYVGVGAAVEHIATAKRGDVAALCAAAPDLLSACEDLIALYPPDIPIDKLPTTVRKARAAIAKARGVAS